MQAVVWCVWLATLVTAAVPIEPQNGTAMATLGAPSVGTGGAMLEASQKFTDFMLAAFVPKVQKQIKGVKLPDQKGKSSGFDYHVRSMKIKTVDLSKSKITFKKSQGLSISVPINIEGALLQHSSPHSADLLLFCVGCVLDGLCHSQNASCIAISGRKMVVQAALHPSPSARQWVVQS